MFRRTSVFLSACMVATLGVAGCGVSSAGASGNPSGAAAAKRAAITAESIPASVGITTPLKSTSPKSKTVVYIACELADCTADKVGVQSAAGMLGWNVQVLQFESANPATLVSALNEALQYHPVAVYFAGLPESTWSSVLPAYKKAGAIIIPNAVGTMTLGPVAITDTWGDLFQQREGELEANEVTASSGGHANVLFVTVPSYPTFLPNQQAFTSTLKHDCPACAISGTVNVSLPDLDAGKLPEDVVSALRRAPSTTHIVIPAGALSGGLTSALASAGLSERYKIVSGTAAIADEQDIQSGTEMATVGTGHAIAAWYAVDATLRHLEHMPLPNYDEITPLTLITKSNVAALMAAGVMTSSGDVNVPRNYAQQFSKLWKIR